MKRAALTQKLLVLGVDGMDPRVSQKFLKEGKMPNLKKLIERGSARNDLRQIGAIPTITPPCWTTLATGAYPGTHGITCYWRQSPESLDAVVYNMDSRNCTAEQIWNITSEADLKTLVWHWPGSSWPPTSHSENLSVVDGTQPGSVNMGVAQLDWEKVIVASPEIEEVRYAPRVEKPAGVGCIITDLEGTLDDEVDDEMMELWWGDTARQGGEIRTYVMDDNDTEIVIGSKVAYDIVNSPLKEAKGWKNAPEGAKEFTIITSSGVTRRPALILKNEAGEYDKVAIYKNKKADEPIVILEKDKMVTGIIDDVTKKEVTKPACRSMKILELDPQGNKVKVWISNALDISNDQLWHQKSLYKDITENVGHVPPVSLIGGEDDELVREIFEPSWAIYDKWQADCLNYCIKEKKYDVAFSHLHNIDCAGHQLWHLAKTLEPWDYTDEKVYQEFIEKFYIQTDDYIGEFLHLLDEGWTVLLVSDHGLMVGENVPPILGEYGGLNTKVMEELGYTVLKKDKDGNSTREVDWDKTRAVQIRSNYIYINLKGRDKYGIVDPKDKYDLEEQIISDLYNYRDDKTGKRVVGICLRNKDAVLIGTHGPECGDIFFSIEEKYNRLHGDSLSTSEGYFDTSVSPIFVAAGSGIKNGFTTERIIRQVDVAPSVSVLLGLRYPAQCEGAPIYQIFSEDI
ncbi:alkaline phosphatase family protein [Clostridium beijerinckii]|uniref:AlkP superfamily phosphohydrolase/phosphomutase n=2 Tax=Clostridium TaxID=1485 RepID=A0A9Q5CY13_CLOBE|nr:alkaline phosphatase family protein [Clostridium beijerinckii]AQS06102.1 type I phosphodiesterase / nucleotide pyrophosphatase [Clostridium beijerinckii]MBA2886138.1 putative AlkP superfamily phosphohydrolase/phosphomutase [Clostridium beijerinckii]MBA2901004.1 putative AlkP superfamily phosphohydrolase/phosphomutase [Clostridium beijerinckii]MBA2910697.1 putative AlkP superfamily phosphohydrolase/phosphomutase [Clostridium beijerinckii]MBA9014292.1 putative AlkP superfamily phosphohydrolas